MVSISRSVADAVDLAVIRTIIAAGRAAQRRLATQLVQSCNEVMAADPTTRPALLRGMTARLHEWAAAQVPPEAYWQGPRTGPTRPLHVRGPAAYGGRNEDDPEASDAAGESDSSMDEQ